MTAVGDARGGPANGGGPISLTALADLIRDAMAAPADELGTLLGRWGAACGLAELALFLVDYQQLHLVPVNFPGAVEPLEIDGTVAGRAFSTGRQIEVAVEGGTRIWTVVTSSCARLGVLGATIPQADEDARTLLAAVATALASLLISQSQYTDRYILARRSRDMTLAAEMQWQLLPPLAMCAGKVSVAGMVEPAYEVGGDTFDYAINGGNLDFALFDAMGHGLRSSELAHMAVTGYRHLRRAGAPLTDLMVAIDDVIETAGQGERFVTCVAGRLNLDDGHLVWHTAGHPRPLLVRGGRVVGALDAEPSPPLGLGGQRAEAAHAMLEPGDRLLAFSDGMVEAHTRGGEPFGEDRLADLLGRETLAGLHPAETVRRLIHAVLNHHAYELNDDATVLLVERPRPEASAGARSRDGSRLEPRPEMTHGAVGFRAT